MSMFFYLIEINTDLAGQTEHFPAKVNIQGRKIG